MTSDEIRQKFLDFFEKRGHTIIPSESLVTPDEKGVTNSTLFNTAGMQPLIPFIMKGEHPKGGMLANVQKCIRTVDIDSVGDNTHATFFEMLGFWSFGEYFKEKSLPWSYEFYTSKEEGLGLDPERIYITVFAGNDKVPRDEKAYEIWKKIVPENRIYFLEDNWWEAGDSGPGGGDSEIFYDTTEKGLGDMTQEEFIAADAREDVVEIGNNVFLTVEKKDGKIIGNLPKDIVDVGLGFDRIVAVVQNKDNIYDTDLFEPIIGVSRKMTDDETAARIIADHFRAATMMIVDGVTPSSSDRGYVLRRLLRKAYVKTKEGLISEDGIKDLVNAVSEVYKGLYDVDKNKDRVIDTIAEEYSSFGESLQNGLKAISKGENDPFKLITTYGLPKEVLAEQGIEIDEASLSKKILEHQELSRKGAEQKFKGGLADTSEMSVKYHTATHLLHQALRDVLGDHVEQKGSNITPDRLRFDFSHDEKMTDEEKEKVTEIVNAEIKKGLPVSYEDMTVEEAKEQGAIGIFEDKYGDSVRVYSMGEGSDKFSFEICGGPHVTNTNELGTFRIKKEEASSQGVRRIKAVLE